MLFSSLASRGEQIRTVSIGKRVLTSFVKTVRLVLVRG